MEKLIEVGEIDASDTAGTTLHHSAYCGKKNTLIHVLDKGIDVDYPNDEGQTPLFCACLVGHVSIVSHLLKSGADPNERTNLGLTSLHAAGYSGHRKILMKLLNEGGDMRLHDYQGRNVKDWAMLHHNPKKRMKILKFLDKTRMFAMSSSGQDLLRRKASSTTLHKAHLRNNTVTKILRSVIGQPSVHESLEKMATSQHSLGFGHVYSDGAERSGFMSAIPLLCENNLKHNPKGETYNNGAFCEMESIWWDYSLVTAKKLHKDVNPCQGGVVDLLINEIEYIGKLRHPNILTLMAVCHTNNLDGMVLVYEKIEEGSLFNYLHQKNYRLPNQMIQDVAVQMCDAIIFIHLRGFVHCAITSHAISVINSRLFKIGNFEYMIEASKCEWGKKNSVATNTAENAIYNWMAPEIMIHMPPSFYSDMFSFCVVLWELFHGDVPWDSQCSENIKSHYSKGYGLICDGRMNEYYRNIVEYGLEQDPTNRKLSFLHVRDMLLADPKDVSSFVQRHFRNLNNHGNDGRIQSRSSVWRDRKEDYTHEQPQTSRNIDSTVADRQRRKDRHRKELKRRECETLLDDTSSLQADRQKLEGRDSDVSRQRKERAASAQTCSTNARAKEKTRSENYGAPSKPVRQIHYSADGLNWDGFPEQAADKFTYNVQLRKESPTKQSYSCADEFDTQRKQRYVPVNTESTNASNVDESNETCPAANSGTDKADYAVGRSLQSKISSMGNFSYLNVGAHERTRSGGEKPACHGQYDSVVEEYSTSGKLSTAGSLYALYNEHSSDLPMGQIEHKREYPHFATLPRAKQLPAPLVEADPCWFGGRGSVRNLAHVFQDQIKQHTYYQAVLDGIGNNDQSEEKLDHSAEKLDHSAEKLDHSAEKLNYSAEKLDHSAEKLDRSAAKLDHSAEKLDHSAEKLDHSAGKLDHSAEKNNHGHEGDRREDIGNHVQVEKPVVVTDGNGSMESVSSSMTAVDTEVVNNVLEATNVDQIAFDVGDDNESSISSFATGTSKESEAVSMWVDYELSKIKRNLSTDAISKYSISTASVQSPDSSENREHARVLPRHQDSSCYGVYRSSSEYTETTPETSDTQLANTLQETGDYVTYGEQDEFYFDDELFQESASNKSSTRRPLSDLPICTSRHRPKPRHTVDDGEGIAPTSRSVKSYLPMKTIMKSPRKETVNVVSTTTDATKMRISRIPMSLSKLSPSKPVSNESAFANVMTVCSSLEETGKHLITHQIKNLKTGRSTTILKKPVIGQTVVSTFKTVPY